MLQLYNKIKQMKG